jgi:hypothetical protein
MALKRSFTTKKDEKKSPLNDKKIMIWLNALLLLRPYGTLKI